MPLTYSCGSCKHFQADRKHKSMGGCAVYRRATMRLSYCSKWEQKLKQEVSK